MRRLATLAVLAGLAVLGGTARAGTFAVVPDAPLALPGLTPNPSLVIPSDLTTPPVDPMQLSYPQLLAIWQRAGAAYGIPWQVLGAINKVESNWGRNMGPSSAGAVGWMQFMPDTWSRWGVDADGNGVADPWNPTDAIFSAARYLAAAGGASDLYRAVYAYNHADWYVQEVLQLANLYGSGSNIAFTLDSMQTNLDAARTAAAHAGERLIAAQEQARRASRVVARWQKRAAHATLLSDRLDDEQQAGLAGERRDTVNTRVAQLQRTLSALQLKLAQAQQASAASTFDPAAAQVLGGPSYSGGYVFPVGGGPSVVTASHTHHDYPAVDIDAPEGSPEYALADSTVLRAWTTPDPRCGIGLTLRAFDGQVWTYCHMSTLDANVVPGATLQAGEPVGLVGSTGDASGPHLHLQLQPATAWPQQEAWFLSFAGKAFSWRDSGPETPGRTLAFVAAPTTASPEQGPVFEVLPTEQTSSPSVVYFTR
jgi:murein DD-endopeptidase MepM/ murein hydrolase activator NlpD